MRSKASSPLLLLLILAALAVLACSLGNRAAAPTIPADTGERLQSAAATAAAAAGDIGDLAGTAVSGVATLAPTAQAAAEGAVSAAATALPTLRATVEALATAAPSMGAGAQEMIATLTAQGLTTIEGLRQRFETVEISPNGSFRVTITDDEWTEAMLARQVVRVAGDDPPGTQDLHFIITPAYVEVTGVVVSPVQGNMRVRFVPYVDDFGSVQFDVQEAVLNDVAVPDLLLNLATVSVLDTINEVTGGLPIGYGVTEFQLESGRMTIIGGFRS